MTGRSRNVPVEPIMWPSPPRLSRDARALRATERRIPGTAVPSLRLVQLLPYDPNGVQIELNLNADGAQPLPEINQENFPGAGENWFLPSMEWSHSGATIIRPPCSAIPNATGQKGSGMACRKDCRSAEGRAAHFPFHTSPTPMCLAGTDPASRRSKGAVIGQSLIVLIPHRIRAGAPAHPGPTNPDQGSDRRRVRRSSDWRHSYWRT